MPKKHSSATNSNRAGNLSDDKDRDHYRKHAPGRKGEAVAKWVHEVAKKRSDAEFELVDIKDFNLPLLDEPVSPIMGSIVSLTPKYGPAKIGTPA